MPAEASLEPCSARGSPELSARHGDAPHTSGLIWRCLQCWVGPKAGGHGSQPCRAQPRLSLNPALQSAAGEGMGSHGELQKRETSCYSTAHTEARLWLSTSSEVLLICIVCYLRRFDVSREVLMPGVPGAAALLGVPSLTSHC